MVLKLIYIQINFVIFIFTYIVIYLFKYYLFIYLFKYYLYIIIKKFLDKFYMYLRNKIFLKG